MTKVNETVRIVRCVYEGTRYRVASKREKPQFWRLQAPASMDAHYPQPFALYKTEGEAKHAAQCWGAFFAKADARTIVASAVLIAKMLGKKYGIKVVNGPGFATACTDTDKVICMPSPKANNSAEIALYRGYLVHEIGHVIETPNPKDWPRVDSLTRNLIGVLEDVRMERASAVKYPGFQMYIVEAIHVMQMTGSMGALQTNEPDVVPLSAIINALLMGLRAQLGQPLTLEALIWEREAKAVWTARVVDKMFKLATPGVMSGASFNDMLIAARAIASLLRKAMVKMEIPEPAQSANSGDPNNAAQNQSATQSPSPQQGDGQSGATEGDGSGNGQASLKPARQKTMRTAQEVAKAIAEQLAATQSGDISDRLREDIDPDAKEWTETHGERDALSCGLNSEASDVATTCLAPAMASKVEVLAATLPIASHLDMLLQARTRSDAYATGSGVFNWRLASRIAVGDPRVFERQDFKEEIDTAFSILFDCSASMDDHGDGANTSATIAKALVLALGDALDQIDVPFSVHGFHDGTVRLKEFEQGWGDARKRLDYVPQGTSLARPMIHTVSHLLVRDEQRKLLLIVTDGAAADLNELEPITRTCTNEGVEVRTILMGPLASDGPLSAKCVPIREAYKAAMPADSVFLAPTIPSLQLAIMDALRTVI